MTDADTAPGAAPSTIEDLAARYTAELEAVLGPRPVALVGWSIGGCVALEMTRRLRSGGAEVLATLLLDSWLPPSAIGDATVAAAARGAFQRMDLLGGEDLVNGRLSEVPAEAARLAALLERNRAAFLGYDPRPLDGTVHLLSAREQFPDPAVRLPGLCVQDDRGWRGRMAQVVVRGIPGDHFSLMSEQHAAELAATVRGLVEPLLAFEEI